MITGMCVALVFPQPNKLDAKVSAIGPFENEMQLNDWMRCNVDESVEWQPCPLESLARYA